MLEQDLLPEVISYLRENYADPLRNGQIRRLLPGELANMLGVNPRVIRAWERGEYAPSHEYVVMMSKIFGVTFRTGCERIHPAIWEKVKKIGLPDADGNPVGVKFEDIPVNPRHIRIKVTLVVEPFKTPEETPEAS